MRYQEFIIEAAYDNLIDKLNRQFPDNLDDIKRQVNWAKTTLKKSDRIMWYLKILGAYLGNQITPKITGNYKFTTLDQLQQDIVHFYGFNYAPIENYQFQKQNIGQVIDELSALVNQWQSKQQAQRPQGKFDTARGDRELIKFSNGNRWVFLNRGYCDQEGQSGLHCGNIVGREKPNQRLLSLRDSNNRVILTFVLEPNSTLGEMKQVGNQKPNERYHSEIMWLLLNSSNPSIKGITGMGYMPDANFSIFDLSDDNLQKIHQNKPKLIMDQLKITPIDILNAPDWIKKQYQQYVSPEIKELLVNASIESWEKIIKSQPDYILYAPDELPDYENRLIEFLIKNSDEIDPATFDIILKTRKEYRTNFKFLSKLLSRAGYFLQTIPPTTRGYRELVMTAIKNNGGALSFVSDELKTPEFCLEAVKNNGLALGSVPKELRTPELCQIAVENNSWALEYVPNELRTPKLYLAAVETDGRILSSVPKELRTPELCQIAVKNDGRALMYVPDELRTPELCQIAVKNNGEALKYVPNELITPELCKIAVENWGRALYSIPNEFKTPELCKIAVENWGRALMFVPKELRTLEICQIAVKNDINALKFVPDELKDKVLQLINQKNPLDESIQRLKQLVGYLN